MNVYQYQKYLLIPSQSQSFESITKIIKYDKPLRNGSHNVTSVLHLFLFFGSFPFPLWCYKGKEMNVHQPKNLI